jgi:hypothetical protein
MNKVVKIKKEKRLIESVAEASSLNFKNVEQGIDMLAYSAGIRSLGLANKELKPRKLSNYIRSGYLQVQLISSVILFQLKGDEGVSRDDLYDSVCEVFPLTTYANFRKILRTGVDSDIFTRTRSKEDSRRTSYALSEEMIEPLCKYYTTAFSDFTTLYAEVLAAAGMSKDETLKLISKLGGKTGRDHRFNNKEKLKK